MPTGRYDDAAMMGMQPQPIMNLNDGAYRSFDRRNLSPKEGNHRWAVLFRRGRRDAAVFNGLGLSIESFPIDG
jgi:hypothetical protein